MDGGRRVIVVRAESSSRLIRFHVASQIPRMIESWAERASEDDEDDDVDEEGKEEECLPQTFRSRKY